MPSIAFSSLCSRFLEHQRDRLKRSTFRSYQSSLLRLQNSLGSVPVASLRSLDLARFIRGELSRGLAPASVNVSLRALSAALNWGRGERLYREAVDVELLTVPRVRRVHTFTSSQLDGLLSIATPRERILILVLGSTGMRIDEALHLKWSDVDEELLRLRITPKLQVGWSPKNHQERSVYVSEFVMGELMDYWERQDFSGERDWVFQSERKRRARLTTGYKRVRELFERAGLYQRGKLFHQLRRAAASTMLRNGVDIETVREIMGHADIATTQLYVFTNEETMRAAASRGLF